MDEPTQTSTGQPLDGLEFAITGRLASMTRERAIEEIESRGGRYVGQPGPATNRLLVGAEGWPFHGDGRPTRALERARELERAGHPIRIVEEADFLQEARLDDSRQGLTHLYTLEQLARILGLERRQTRRLLRLGLIRPARVVRRLATFEFQEVARAKALMSLIDSGASTSALLKSVKMLRRWLPEEAEQAIQQLEILEHGSPLLLQTDSGLWAEPSGQLQLPFADAEFGAPQDREAIDDRPALPFTRPDPKTAEEWFQRGLECEANDQLDDAFGAYHQALLMDRPRPEIHFNLGNVLHGLGRVGEAAQRYMVAVELDPDYAEAWNNLGNALGETERLPAAIEAYRHALTLEPSYADAHFNLAETLQQSRRFEEAIRHWEAYLDGAPGAPDRGYVDRMLAHCRSSLPKKKSAGPSIRGTERSERDRTRGPRSPRG
ncbi:MAG: tetratricopeptide repeat protein [Planctomycetota bacterium]